jgi:hypothetical protein
MFTLKTTEQKMTEQQQQQTANREMDKALLIKSQSSKPVERIRGIMI